MNARLAVVAVVAVSLGSLALSAAACSGGGDSPSGPSSAAVAGSGGGAGAEAGGEGGSGGSEPVAGAGGQAGGWNGKAAGGQAGMGGSAGAAGGAGAPSSNLKKPPAPNASAPVSSGPDVTFVFTRVNLGDVDADGQDTGLGWLDIGFDLDGAVTDKFSLKKQCKPMSWNFLEKLYDGPGGLDNSWGKNVVFLWNNYGLRSELDNVCYGGGVASHAFVVRSLGGAHSYSSGLQVEFLGPVKGGQDGSKVAWHPFDDQLSSSSPLTGKTTFSSAYVSKNTLVAQGDGDLTFFVALSTLDVGGNNVPLRLTVHKPLLVAPFDELHAAITRGTLAGQLDAKELRQAFARYVGGFEPESCTSMSEQANIDFVEMAADMLSDLSIDPSKTCDTISFAISFDAAESTLADPVPAIPDIDPCTKGP